MGESDDEFLTPADAIKALPSGRAVAIEAIAGALANGVLGAVSEVAVALGGNRTNDFEIPPSWWKKWTWWDDDAFWEVGTTAFPQNNTSAGYGGASRQPMTAYGIRLHVQGLRLLGAKIETPEKPPQSISLVRPEEDRSALPRLPEALLQKWFAFWSETYPPSMQNHDTALAHALASFPKHQIARARVRAIRGDLKPGPKPGAAE